MILKRKQKEHKEDTLDDLKAKDAVYKDGVAAGITGTVVGGLAAGLGYYGGRVRENARNKSLKILEEHPQMAKVGGIGLAATSAGLATASAIKHRKLKKKIKEKEDDNSEKK